MAFLVADRVKETTTTTGTGTLTLGGAVAGFQTFAAIGNGNTCYACVYGVNAAGNPTGEWEVFIGTYASSGTTLARTTVLASSNGGSAVNLSAGTKHVIVTLPAVGYRFDSTGKLTIPSAVTVQFGSTSSTIMGYSSGTLELRGTGCGIGLGDGLGSGKISVGNSHFGFSSNVLNTAPDVSYLRLAAKVLAIRDGSTGGGWLQNTGGLSRVSSAVTNAGTTLANITGLSATLIAGRKYTGKLVLFVSNDTAGDGLKIDFNGGTATMTSFQAAVTGNAGGATAGTMHAESLSAPINLTAALDTNFYCIEVTVGFVCDAAGTFIPRVAKDSDAGGANVTVYANSFMELQDAP